MRHRQRWLITLSLLVATGWIAGAARAQVFIQRGGTPARLGGLKTVALQQETVGFKIGNDEIRVTGRYRLKNQGKAGTVKLGFPVYVYGDVSVLNYLRVASKGKNLKTRLTKTSQFPKIADSFYGVSLALKAGETREISCDYRVVKGGFFADTDKGNYNIDTVDYMNGGGSTWSGPLERPGGFVFDAVSFRRRVSYGATSPFRHERSRTGRKRFY